MSEALAILNQVSLFDSPDVISSQESVSGIMPSASLAGPKVSKSGQARARASRSPWPAKGKAKQTRDTFGQRGFDSSPSADLAWCLASKLRMVTESLGSTLFALTWSQWATESGHVVYRLRASVRRTGGTGFTSWPTPAANEYEQSDQEKLNQRRAILKSEKKNGNGFGLTLVTQANMTAWNTPRATDGSKGGPNQSGGALPADVALATWATPTKRDHKDGDCSAQLMGGAVKVDALLGRQVLLTDSGTTPNGSHARTESRGQLNPEHSRWLMGLPPEFCDCAVMAMESLCLKRRHLSKRI